MVSYLGHVVSAEGVAMDGLNVQAVGEWLVPRSLRAAHVFLDLVGYYMCFIKGCDTIAAPLTRLLKKEDFEWTNDAARAFKELK